MLECCCICIFTMQCGMDSSGRQLLDVKFLSLDLHATLCSVDMMSHYFQAPLLANAASSW